MFSVNLLPYGNAFFFGGLSMWDALSRAAGLPHAVDNTPVFAVWLTRWRKILISMTLKK
jgi:hypothetical protein